MEYDPAADSTFLSFGQSNNSDHHHHVTDEEHSLYRRMEAKVDYLDYATEVMVQETVVNKMYPVILTTTYERQRRLNLHQNTSERLVAHSQFMTHPVSLSQSILYNTVLPNIESMQISEKSDGIRAWLLLFKKRTSFVPPPPPLTAESTSTKERKTKKTPDLVEDVALVLNRAGRMWPLPGLVAPAHMFNGTLIDGELMPPCTVVDEHGNVTSKSEFIMFDLVEFCATKKWIPESTFGSRQAALELLSLSNLSAGGGGGGGGLAAPGIMFTTKKWSPLSRAIDGFASADDWIRSMTASNRSDGWIIQNVDIMPYKPTKALIRREVTHKSVFKAKVLHTVDFWVTKTINQRGQPCFSIKSDDDVRDFQLVIPPEQNDNIAGAVPISHKYQLWASSLSRTLSSSSSSSSSPLFITEESIRRLDLMLSVVTAATGLPHIVEFWVIVEKGLYGDVTAIMASPCKVRTDKAIANSSSTIETTIVDATTFGIYDLFHALRLYRTSLL